MSIQPFVWDVVMIVFFCAAIYLIERKWKEILKLEQEKALKIGHDAGVNWTLDLSVDEYVTQQQLRKENSST
jgi:hypothetical protein